MNKEGKKLVERALQNQRPHEKYYKALSRTVSEEKTGKKGYSLYLDLIREVREKARKDDISIEESAKEIIGKK